MKKTCIPALVLCVSLLLSACIATDPDNLFEMPRDTVANAETTQLDSDKDASYSGTYPYGNMQSDRNFLLLGNEVVFLHNENGKTRLYTYELNTEDVRFYCDDATCKHSACVSADFKCDLEVYDGKLYGRMWAENCYLPAMASGNDVKAVVEGDVGDFIHYEDRMYIEAGDKSLALMEAGEIEPQIILEEFVCDYFLVLDEYLYSSKGLVESAFTRVNLTEENLQEEVLLSNVWGCKTDGEHIYYVEANTYRFYRCDMDGSNPERLLKEKIGVNFNFDNEYVYYTVPVDLSTYHKVETHDIYRFPKDDPTNVEKIATLPEAVWYIYTVPGTGKIFVDNYLPDESVKPVKYVMNNDGSNLKKLDIPEA